MQITYIGHSCFEIKGKKNTIVLDPYNPDAVGYKFPSLSADITTISHAHKDHNFVEGLKEPGFVISSAGEYEIKDTFIYGLSTFHDKTHGEDRGSNIIYIIEDDGINVLHLGDLGHPLSDETLKQLPDIHVLMIPVGGNYTIDAEVGANVISSIEPGFVIPMHYATKDLSFEADLAPLDAFLDEMGIENGKKDVFKIDSAAEMPEETEIVVLNPQH